MLQHVAVVTESSPSAAPRIHVLDATSRARIGYALGAPEDASAGPPQVLVVDEKAILLVPTGEVAPPALPPAAAPAMRRLLERSPEWIGTAYVVTLAGGPSTGLCAALTSLPGVLEVAAGLTGRAAAQGSPTAVEIGMGQTGWVEAVQLAVDPSLPLEALLDAFWAAHSPAASSASAIFYHSAAQRDVALSSRDEQYGYGAECSNAWRRATCIKPATAFWEADGDTQGAEGMM